MNTINTNIIKTSQSNNQNSHAGSIINNNTNKKSNKNLNSNSIINPSGHTVRSNYKNAEASINNGVSQFNFNEGEMPTNIKPTCIQTPKQTEAKSLQVNNSKLNSSKFYSPNKFLTSESKDSKDFLGKKRHLSKVYQNMIDNNLKNSGKLKFIFNILLCQLYTKNCLLYNLLVDADNKKTYISEKKQNSLSINMKEEKENFKDTCFSSFEI